jgi:hypothetical protein
MKEWLGCCTVSNRSATPSRNFLRRHMLTRPVLRRAESSPHLSFPPSSCPPFFHKRALHALANSLLLPLPVHSLQPIRAPASAFSSGRPPTMRCSARARNCAPWRPPPVSFLYASASALLMRSQVRFLCARKCASSLAIRAFFARTIALQVDACKRARLRTCCPFRYPPIPCSCPARMRCSPLRILLPVLRIHALTHAFAAASRPFASTRASALLRPRLHPCLPSRPIPHPLGLPFPDCPVLVCQSARPTCMAPRATTPVRRLSCRHTSYAELHLLPMTSAPTPTLHTLRVCSPRRAAQAGPAHARRSAHTHGPERLFRGHIRCPAHVHVSPRTHALPRERTPGRRWSCLAPPACPALAGADSYSKDSVGGRAAEVWTAAAVRTAVSGGGGSPGADGDASEGMDGGSWSAARTRRWCSKRVFATLYQSISVDNMNDKRIPGNIGGWSPLYARYSDLYSQSQKARSGYRRVAGYISDIPCYRWLQPLLTGTHSQGYDPYAYPCRCLST